MRFFRSVTPAPAPEFTPGAGIVFSNVTFTDVHGERTILDSVNLKLIGASTAILGLNGSGKSTLLKLINGINTPTSGSVVVDGVSVAAHQAAVRSRVGLLFSNPLAQLLMPTPVEDIELSLRSGIKDAPSRTARALELLRERGIEHLAHSSVYDLSGGEQQLVALTSVLAVQPRVLLLDEPTTLLDLRNQLRLLTLLDGLDQQLVVSTHDLELAAQCERAVIIHGGQVYAQGAAEDVIELYRYWCATEFPSTPPVAAEAGEV